MLQAYALQQKIKTLGFECENIDYRKIGVIRMPAFNWDNIKNPIAFLKSLLRYFLLPKKRAKAHRAFSKEYLSLSTKYYDKGANLQSLNDEYDAFIVGSDQVWNTKLISNDPVFFFDFVNQTRKKLAYAASFGHIYPTSDKLYNKILDFDHIAVRELSAKKFLAENFNCQSTVTLDPVFLLSPEMWNNIALPPKNDKPFIFCYVMKNDPYIDDFCMELSRKHNLEIIKIASVSNLMLRERFKRMKLVFNAGPREFLGYMKKAEIVVTSSFHGAAFSVIFKKQFYSILDNGLENKNARIESLHNLLNIPNRVISIGQKKIIENEHIDFTKTEKLLKLEIQRSNRFIINSFEGKA
jgi:hypothetical protein